MIMSDMLIIPFICLIFYIALLMILISSRKNKIAKYYVVYIISMIIWTLGSLLMKTGLAPYPLFYNRILMIGMLSQTISFYHFTLVLTGTKRRKMLYMGYATYLFLIIANFFGLIVESVTIENGKPSIELGPLVLVGAIWGLIYYISALIIIFLQIKKGQMSFKRVKYVIYGIVLMIIGVLLNLDTVIAQYGVDIALNLINALLIAYAIFKYKFLEIKTIVKNGISYSIYTLLLSTLYIIAIGGLQMLFYNLLGAQQITTIILIAVILAFVFQPLKNFMQNIIDKVFYEKNISYQAIMREYSMIVNNSLELNQLTHSLIKTIKKGIHPKLVSIVLEKDNKYVLYDPRLKEKWSKIAIFRNNNPIINWFKSGQAILTISDIETNPYFKSFWSDEKRTLYKLEAEIIVPILLREELTGFVMISENRDEETYTSIEIDLLQTVINQTAVAFENARLYENAKTQAVTDGLTQLHNHRYFQEKLSNIILDDSVDFFSVIIIDVDLFKVYNDLFGHSAGDRALVRIAKILKETTREDDIIARYGGEEFALIMPNTTTAETFVIIEEVRKKVEYSFYEDNNEIVTISSGISSYPNDGESPKMILDFADAAMYSAKRSGRNKTIVYSSGNTTNLDKELQETKRIQESIEDAYLASIYALAAAIDAKDSYTFGHSENVSSYAVKLAEKAGFTEEKINVVKNAGLLHDIGKIGIPEKILTKTTKLDEYEFEIMKKHVDFAIPIIKHVPNLVHVIPAVYSHHERYDGKGYPRGISGKNIPIEGRCLCIVDAFDAMTSDRPYREALSKQIAISELKKHRGTQFDPELVDIFLELVESGEIEIKSQ